MSLECSVCEGDDCQSPHPLILDTAAHGWPDVHTPDPTPPNVSARITPQGKAYVQWLKTNPERSTLAAFAAGWNAGRAVLEQIAALSKWTDGEKAIELARHALESIDDSPD